MSPSSRFRCGNSASGAVGRQRRASGRRPVTVQPASRRAVAGLDAEAFAQLVRDALTKLYDPVYLQTHPLAARAGGGADGGAVARRRLEAAIVPARGELGARGGPGGRGPALLRARYVEALEVPAVCRTLGLSRSQFYVEHRRAVDALTGILWERWGAGPSEAVPAPAEAPPTNLPE